MEGFIAAMAGMLLAFGLGFAAGARLDVTAEQVREAEVACEPNGGLHSINQKGRATCVNGAKFDLGEKDA